MLLFAKYDKKKNAISKISSVEHVLWGYEKTLRSYFLNIKNYWYNTSWEIPPKNIDRLNVQEIAACNDIITLLQYEAK